MIATRATRGTRRAWRLALLTSCALAVLTACATPAPTPTTPATAVPRDKLAASYTSVDMQSLPVLFAKDKKLFETTGLDVELVSLAGQTGTAALVSGGIQVYEGGGSETVLADAGGSDVVTVAVTSPIYPWKFYVRDGINSVSDLKGKKIGITSKGGAYDTGLHQALPKLGIDPDTDVALVSTGSIQNVTAALMSGAIDGAAIIVGTDSFKVETAGYKALFDFSAFGGIPVAGISVRREFIDTHHAAVQKFVDGLVQSLAAMKANRAATLALMKTSFAIDDDAALNEMYDYYTTEVYAVPPYPRAEHFANLADQLAVSNEKVRQVDASTIVDASFVQSAVDRGLDKAPASPIT